jgi:Na+/melibiose symporter-like transporter
VRTLLRHRDARLLLAGESLSVFGDRAMFLALGVWAKQLTGSNAAAGLVFFFLAAPSLLAPLGGMVVDRVKRRQLMIAVDLVIAALLLLLLLVHGRGQLWLLYLVAVAYGAAGLVFSSAQSALLQTMLPGELLASANGFFQTMREGLRLVAPLAGAGLFSAFGGGAVAIVDASTFVASAVALSLLRVHERRPRPAEQHVLAELTAGARHILASEALRRIVGATAVALLVVGFAETVIFAVVHALGRPPAFFGVLAAAQGVGAIAGGLSAPTLLRRLGDVRVVGCGVALFAAGDLALVSTSLPVVLVGIAVAGCGISHLVVAFGTAIQRRTPDALQGRVYSAADSIVGTPQTISIAVGAGLSTVVDYRILVVAMAVVTAGAGAYLLTRRTARTPEIAAQLRALEAPGEPF